MATYTAQTSDRRKKKVLISWLIGFIGLLGFEYFYVGLIKKGLIRLILGLFMIGLFFAASDGTEAMTALRTMIIIVWIVLALFNLIRILLGIFRDNVGSPVREW